MYFEKGIGWSTPTNGSKQVITLAGEVDALKESAFIPTRPSPGNITYTHRQSQKTYILIQMIIILVRNLQFVSNTYIEMFLQSLGPLSRSARRLVPAHFEHVFFDLVSRKSHPKPPPVVLVSSLDAAGRFRRDSSLWSVWSRRRLHFWSLPRPQIPSLLLLLLRHRNFLSTRRILFGFQFLRVIVREGGGGVRETRLTRRA